MFKRLSSVKLTLILLLLLAVVAVGGTLVPVASQRYEVYYQSLWFRLLLGLLALNLLCCTIKLFPQKWHYRRCLQETLQTRRQGQRLTADSLPELAERLTTAGYRVVSGPEQLLADRGSPGRWGSTLVHCAILLIMLGGLWGETGFVGTINTYLQQPNHRYFDWDKQQNRELGFQFRADAFRLRYYPIQLRFELLDAATGSSYGRLQLYDHESFQVPDSLLRVQLQGFDPEARILSMDVRQRGVLLGRYLVGDGFERFGNVRHPSFRVNRVEFRDPILKQIETDVSVLDGGRLVKRGTIRANQPLTYRGVSFYQTAYGEGESGNRSVGFQLSKDPGEGLVWAAAFLLMFGLAIAFLLPRRALGIKTVSGQLCLCPLVGWQGEGGQQRLDELIKLLNA